MKRLENLFAYVVATLFAATTVVAAVAVAVLLVKGPAHQGPEQVAVPAAQSDQPSAPTPVTPTASTGTTRPAAQTAESQPAEASGVDLAAGESAWRQCRACHQILDGGRNGTGPNLWGIVGSQAASHEGFNYSDALRGADRVWDAEQLDAFLTRPSDAVPGTRMAFNGIRDAQTRRNLIAWIAQQSDTPLSPEDLGLASGEAAIDVAPEPTAAPMPDVDYQALLESFQWMNPPARSEEDAAAARARAEVIAAALPTMDYNTARYHPLHTPPASLTASNEECLVCHSEVLTDRPREASQAGVPASATIAWYQTLDTYTGDQQSFHYRHLQSAYAQQTMNLECRFCHVASDPREETPDMIVGRAQGTAPEIPEFTLRRMVNPSTTCLRCHGSFPAETMGLPDEWHVIREDFEYEPGINGCLSCHEETFRTNRHSVTYLNAGTIEAIARSGSSDSCYGCHGGRSWYRNSYPYPRTPWPEMAEDLPEWAIGRPTASDPVHAFTPLNPAE